MLNPWKRETLALTEFFYHENLQRVQSSMFCKEGKTLSSPPFHAKMEKESRFGLFYID